MPPTRPEARSLAVFTARPHEVPPPLSIDTHRGVRARGAQGTPVDHHQRVWNGTTEAGRQQGTLRPHRDNRRSEPRRARRSGNRDDGQTPPPAKLPATVADPERGNAPTNALAEHNPRWLKRLHRQASSATALSWDHRCRRQRRSRGRLGGNRDDGRPAAPATLRVAVVSIHVGRHTATWRADHRTDKTRGDGTSEHPCGHRRTKKEAGFRHRQRPDGRNACHDRPNDDQEARTEDPAGHARGSCRSSSHRGRER